jgi:methionyl-tRNA formyltransferase
MGSLRVVFLGSSSFAVPSLRRVYATQEVVAVVTQPDRPGGRGRRSLSTPVKVAAGELGLPVHEPDRVRSARFVTSLRELAPSVLVVVAYGQLLPTSVLEVAPFGCVNVHASLLPKYRGAAPIQRALWNGETETGVSVMRLDEGEDTGPVFAQERLAIGPDETALELGERLAELGADRLVDVLATLSDRTPVPQDGALATRAPRLSRAMGQLDWTLPTATLYNRFRACVPWPGSYTYLLDGSRLRVLDCRPGNGPFAAEPGTVRRGDGALEVRTGDGLLTLRRVQPENRAAMSAEDYANGFRGRLPERFTWRDDDREGGIAERCVG